MAEQLGQLAGGVFVTYLVLRFWMFVFSYIPSTWPVRLGVAVVFSGATGVMISSAGGAGPSAISIYLVAAIVAGAIEMLRRLRAVNQEQK